MAMISLLIGILIICVVGAICFWAIDKFVRDGRLANLLKLLVVLICLASILQRVLPLAGIGGLLSAWLRRALSSSQILSRPDCRRAGFLILVRRTRIRP